MRVPHLPPNIWRAQRREQAGFTLVELMVAMTGGLFLSIVVFALSRDASRFYQRESRVANATLAGVSGFERLSSDIARAGHLTTPNITSDPRVCNRPAANWPAMLQKLRAILIEEDTLLTDSTEIGDASIKPEGVVIAGALNMPEVFTTASVVENGAGGWEVSINTATPAAARAGLSPDNTATASNLAVLQSTFIAPGNNGRIVRLRKKGMDQYGTVANVAASPGTEIALALVNLTPTPALIRPANAAELCGIADLGKDMDFNVVDLVRYSIRSMTADANYAALYKASGLGTGGGASALPYEAKRAELVRVELTPAGTEIEATREIVGEYAVDLQFNAWRATNATNPALLAVGESVNDTYASTHLIRGLNVRFSVRSREADRERGITLGTGGTTNNLYRMPLAGPGGTQVFARVRTFQSNIALRNLENSNW
jgi:hypothetical protein